MPPPRKSKKKGKRGRHSQEQDGSVLAAACSPLVGVGVGVLTFVLGFKTTVLGLLGWDTEPLAADGALPADRSPWLPNATAEALWAEPITAPHQCTFDVVASSELTAAQFDARYWGRKPVLIRGWAPPADVSARSARPRLLAEFGERLQVEVGIYSRPADAFALHAGRGSDTMSMRAFLRRMRADNGTAGPRELPYIFSRQGLQATYQAEGNGLRGGERDDFLWNHKGFSDLAERWSRAMAPSLKNRFGRSSGEDGSSITFTVGGASNGLSWHPHHDALLQVLHGTKFWALYPPWHTPPGGAVAGTIESFFRSESGRAFKKEGGGKLLHRCVQRAGDLLYVPEDWLHAVLNLGETIALGKQHDRPHSPTSHEYRRCKEAYQAARTKPSNHAYDAAFALLEPFVFGGRQNGGARVEGKRMRGPGAKYAPAVSQLGILKHLLFTNTRDLPALAQAKHILQRAAQLNSEDMHTQLHLGLALRDVLPEEGGKAARREQLRRAGAALAAALALAKEDGAAAQIVEYLEAQRKICKEREEEVKSESE